MKKRQKNNSQSKKPIWNLKLLYRSPDDPEIEVHMRKIEESHSVFAKKYDTDEKKYLEDESSLVTVLTDYEILMKKLSDLKPIKYFQLLMDIEADNKIAPQKISLFENRLAKSENTITFFRISLGTISPEKQKVFLTNPKLEHFKIFLERIFIDARYQLSIPEEKIINLKGLPAHDMWVMANERILNNKPLIWKGRKISLARASKEVASLSKQKDRRKLSAVIAESLKSVAPFAEAEINAIGTNKKINDELRGYETPYQNTIRGYRNDPVVINRLIEVVGSYYPLAHKFYELKAKILNLKFLSYCDRAAHLGKIKTSFSFSESIRILKKTFGALNPDFGILIQNYAHNGQIDALPRIGKQSGAYCSSSYTEPTFILLNHTDDFRSFTTFGHELGHAIHSFLSRAQSPLYFRYSTSLAETASTLFESIAVESIFDQLTSKEKIIVLHDRIGDNIATIFRQIACFNFENEIHASIRVNGYVSKEELADLHNKHMSAYLGPTFKLERDDGYFFVQWSHIRRFFYVYTYAYGMLVSKALLRRYRADKSFWKSIEKFLSSGGNGSPEEILKSIGIDVNSSRFFEEGLEEIKNDIAKLKTLL